MKLIKVTLKHEVCVPDNAEIIRILDDEGIEDNYIRVAGKLVRPDLHWMQYYSENNPDPQFPASSQQELNGISFSQIDLEFEDKYLKRADLFGEYSLETINNI
jgi:hypothetical protein